MAVQWMENWQQYGTTAANLLNGPYASTQGTLALVADPDPTAGGTTVIRLTSSDSRLTTQNWGSNIRKVIPTAAATIGAMWRWWVTQLPDGSHSMSYHVSFPDANNIAQVTIGITPTGTLKVWRGGPYGTQIAESSIAIVTNAWQHVEAKVVIHGSAGSVEIRVDTVVVLNATGLNTQNGLTTIAGMVLGTGDDNGTHSASSWMSYWKDWAIWDTSGAINTNFLGSCFVYSMRPDSDVSGTWTITGGAGSAFASINETNPDDDTKYISSPWPAATADVLTLTDLPTDATTVKALMAFVRSKKSDGGDGNLQVSLISGASTGNGADRPITTAYTYWSDIFETDPATSAQWTVAATNAVKVKFNRTL